MSGKLLETNNTSVEELIKRINDIIGSNFEILDETDDIQKWNGLPKLLLLDEITQKRLLSFIEFMDSLLIPVETKAMLLISLSGLMEFGNIKLYDYDDGSLFTLSDYYKDSSIDKMKQTIKLIGNKELLLAIRKKTLELDTRKRILSSIEKKFFNDKINIMDSEAVSKFIKDTIQDLTAKDYYEL